MSGFSSRKKEISLILFNHKIFDCRALLLPNSFKFLKIIYLIKMDQDIKYDFTSIEKKWQDFWELEKTFLAE
ncbi:MAG: hypothetical protein CMI27_02225, partial [Opitutae bacterium]|nr:hypothetical protein [Opitutae bacterium]